MCKLVVEETGLLPHANAGAISREELELLRARLRLAGHDDREPARGPAVPSRRAGQAARPPARHARGRRRAGDPVHDGHPGRHRRGPPGPDRRAPGDRRVPRPPRPRAGGDRPELPAQAGHRDARSPAVPGGGAPGRDPAGAAILPRDVHVQAPPNLAERPRRAAGRGHRRLGRRLAGHRRLRQPRAAVAVAASACARRPRPRATCSRRAWRSTPSSSTRLAPPGPALRGARPRRRRGPRPRRPGRRAPAALRGRRQRRRRRRGQARRPPLDRLVLGRRRAAPSELRLTRPSPAARSGEVLDGVAGRPGARRSRRSSRSSARAAPRSAPSPRSPTSCAARRSATSSRSSAPATSTTRTSARSSAGSARSRRAR